MNFGVAIVSYVEEDNWCAIRFYCPHKTGASQKINLAMTGKKWLRMNNSEAGILFTARDDCQGTKPKTLFYMVPVKRILYDYTKGKEPTFARYLSNSSDEK